MVDYALEMMGEENAPPEMMSRRDSVFEQMELLEQKTTATRAIFEDAEQVEGLRQRAKLNAAGLLEIGVSASMLDDYYDLAKFLYECGDYQAANDMLTRYLEVHGTATGKNRFVDALWGKFASDVFLKDWEAALADLNKLRAVIDDSTRNLPALEQLQQRSWVLHWSLFVFFNHDKGHDGIIDLFLSDKYLQAIQTNCPWLLRYPAAAVVINKRRRSVLRDLVKVVSQDKESRLGSDEMRDPITHFVDCLFADFDFDAAQSCLADCDKALKADYFLCNCRDAFMNEARTIVFEAYFRIHTTVDLRLLSSKLNLDVAATERWVVDLIRGALLDAKIDSQNNCVIMGTHAPSVYAQVIDKTRDLYVRSNALINNIDLKILKADDQRKLLSSSAGGGRD
mmetsp:Transcript_23079/g.70902  ORF Transcript_23079/g.70902 Transcript_23079/m.70902 type:complete len:396 (+) Transcript_23079:411-1598(+)